MKKMGILFLLMAIVIIISSPQKVFADETSDLRNQYTKYSVIGAKF